VASETNTPADAIVEPVVKEEAAAETPIAVAAEGPIQGPAKAGAKTKKKAARVQEIEGTERTERNEEMAYEDTKAFTAFTAFPAAQAFEKLFADAAGRGEEAVKRSRKAAEELADIARANVDAFVEAGRIATSGAQSIGQQVLAKGRDKVDYAATTVRSLAEAKTPADVLQVQSDYVRGAFDRFVEDSANLTESLVKLVGEAFEPLSTRASLNVERFNELVA
jgi:phasin family protein